MNTAERAWIEPETPYPPRWRTTKRLAAAYVVVLVCFGCLYAAWVAHARTRWERGIAAIRARGEPATSADLSFVPVPESQDAAPMLTRAAKGIENAFAFQWPKYDLEDARFAMTDADRALFRVAMEKHAASLRLVRESRKRARARTGGFGRARRS